MIYLDNAATTKVSQEFIDDAAMIMKDYWGNPSSPHSVGKKAKDILEESREIIAATINASPENIIFTSGGTESNNLAINTLYELDVNITSKIEHPSILKPATDLYFGMICPESTYGFISPDSLGRMISSYIISPDETVGVSIMFANNEIGTLQDIKKLAEVTHLHNGVFHTDAVQAYCHVPIDVQDLGIDMMSVSGHKFGCAKGCGFLYSNASVAPIILGGNQENMRRAGTENLPYIYAMAQQAKKMCEHIDASRKIILQKTDYLIRNLYDVCFQNDVGVFLNGPSNLEKRLPGNVSVSLKDIDAQVLVSTLDIYDICISAGSACKSSVPEPSHVLKAIGLTDKEARETIRINVGLENSYNDINGFLTTLNMILPMFRKVDSDV